MESCFSLFCFFPRVTVGSGGVCVRACVCVVPNSFDAGVENISLHTEAPWFSRIQTACNTEEPADIFAYSNST